MSFGLARSPYTFQAVPGYFVYTDPAIDNDALPAIAPRFGLVEGMTWTQLVSDLQARNADATQTGEHFKLVYTARHGEGVHNVAEAKYGTKAWDDHWAMLTTDGELTWAPDPELTGLGAQQAHDVRKAWQDHLGAPDQAERPPLPAAFFASPLARSANTLRLSYEGIAWPTSAEGAGEAAAAQAAAEAASPSRPFILESLRENFADRHTCDQRSRRSDVAKRWEALGWSVDTAMPQDDELFASDYVESKDDMTERLEDALAVVWERAGTRLAINITSHSGTMQALFRAVHTDDFKPKTGGMVPLVIKATRKHGVQGKRAVVT